MLSSSRRIQYTDRLSRAGEHAEHAELPAGHHEPVHRLRGVLDRHVLGLGLAELRRRPRVNGLHLAVLDRADERRVELELLGHLARHAPLEVDLGGEERVLRVDVAVRAARRGALRHGQAVVVAQHLHHHRLEQLAAAEEALRATSTSPVSAWPVFFR
jgi:hypothetical protein